MQILREILKYIPLVYKIFCLCLLFKLIKQHLYKKKANVLKDDGIFDYLKSSPQNQLTPNKNIKFALKV